MEQHERLSWKLRMVSWPALGLTWIVLLAYKGIIAWNVHELLDAAVPLTLISTLLQAVAIPGLPPALLGDGLLLLLVSVVFVLTLRATPTLLHARSAMLQSPTPALEATIAPAVETWGAPPPESAREHPDAAVVMHPGADSALSALGIVVEVARASSIMPDTAVLDPSVEAF
jgi:hypothetical protein